MGQGKNGDAGKAYIGPEFRFSRVRDFLRERDISRVSEREIFWERVNTEQSKRLKKIKKVVSVAEILFSATCII
jgi:hypothetical protein